MGQPEGEATGAAPGGPDETLQVDESGLLDAILSVASDLDLPGVLRRIVVAACDLTDARYGALGVLDEAGGSIAEFITHGLSDDEETRIGPRPTGKGILGLLLTDPRPIRLARLADHPSSFGFPAHHPPMGSFLGVPIRVRGLVYGNLYMTEKQGAAEFSQRDERLATSLAAAAGVAIDNARLHQRLGELALYQDRERIARNLHDTVIQRLFAVGLGLQGLARVVDPPEAGDKLEAAVDDIDATIADIRSTIFALQVRGDSGLRAGITEVVLAERDALGFLATVQFDGPVDSAVDDEVADDAIATVREALSNVARHARATRVQVRLEVSDDELWMTVADDGIGIRQTASRSGHGLRNMAERAERLGGSLDVRSRPGEGTTLTWRVPARG